LSVTATKTNARTQASSRDEGIDYYKLLGVSYTATFKEITRGYREAMKRAHPDRARPERRTAAEEFAKRLNLAYATLSKPATRRAYDETIKVRAVQDQIMGRYVGGFYVPQADGHDPLARHLRRERTPAERRERAAADRGALVSIVLVFGGITLAVVAVLLLWSILEAVVGAAF
jgi:DnaJ-class molecular chaperone